MFVANFSGGTNALVVSPYLWSKRVNVPIVPRLSYATANLCFFCCNPESIPYSWNMWISHSALYWKTYLTHTCFSSSYIQFRDKACTGQCFPHQKSLEVSLWPRGNPEGSVLPRQHYRWLGLAVVPGVTALQQTSLPIPHSVVPAMAITLGRCGHDGLRRWLSLRWSWRAECWACIHTIQGHSSFC